MFNRRKEDVLERIRPVETHYLFRIETRCFAYYYRADHPRLDGADWPCFTLSRYDRRSDASEMEKAPVYHIVDQAMI